MANAAGFRPLRRPGMGELPFEYEQMTDATAVTLGAALVLTNGKLALAGATTTPQFVAAGSAAAVTPGAIVPVLRVDELTEWTTQSNATVAATLIGQKVTMHTDAKLVTATTTSGVFEISETDGATTTSNVRGRFRQ